MTETRKCNATVASGRLSKANEFFEAAEHLESDMPTPAGDLYVNAGIAAADVICCVRLGMHSSTANRNEARSLLKKADSGSELVADLLGYSSVAIARQRISEFAGLPMLNDPETYRPGISGHTHQ